MTLRNASRQTVRLPRWGRKKRGPPTQTLRLTPYAWAKLVCLRDLGPTEVGAFGLSGPDDLLLVEDVILVQQRCTGVTVKFDDEAVADYFDAQIDESRKPEEFARIWIHTHPGNSPVPSCTDEATFERCFGGADWSVMFILACGGRTYARMRFAAGPGGRVVMPVEIDFSRPFPAAAAAAWEEEYAQCVSLEMPDPPRPVLLPAEPTRRDHPLLAEHSLESSEFFWPREAYYDERFF